MTRYQSFVHFIRGARQPTVYIIGGIVLVIWLLLTPTGILGKADAIGYAVCHRIDARSFHIGVRQLPLCARCTGQYLGAVTGLIFLGVFGKRRSGFPPKGIMGVSILLIIIYAVDGLNSYLSLPQFIKYFPNMPHLYPPLNVLRLFTGTGMGLVIAIVLYPAFWSSVLTNPDIRPAIQDLRTLLVLISLGILVDMLVLTGAEYVLYPVAFIATGGVQLILGMAYTVLWIRLLHKENQFTRLSQIIPMVIGGFMISMVQLALFDLIRFIITGTWDGLILG